MLINAIESILHNSHPKRKTTESSSNPPFPSPKFWEREWKSETDSNDGETEYEQEKDYGMADVLNIGGLVGMRRLCIIEFVSFSTHYIAGFSGGVENMKFKF